MPNRPSARLALLLGTTLALSATTAQAEDGAFEVYGLLNLGILDFDDGVESGNFLVDNSSAPSRVGFNYDTEAGAGTLRLKFETALGLVSSTSVDLENGAGDAIDFDKTDLRYFEAIYKSETAGTFWFGQGEMATDGIAGADLSGTTNAAAAAISDIAGGNIFRDEGGAFSGVTVGSTNSNLGGSRRFRARYDSPSFSGVTLAASYGQEILQDDDDNDYYDLALLYQSVLGNFETDGRLGYGWDGDTSERLTGSFAMLHLPTGLNGAIAAGSADDGGSYYWIKAGVRRDWFSIGESALSVDFYAGDDFVSSGSETDSWALAYTQDIDAANLEAFFVYREYGFDETATNYRDGRAIFVGSKWSF